MRNLLKFIIKEEVSRLLFEDENKDELSPTGSIPTDNPDLNQVPPTDSNPLTPDVPLDTMQPGAIDSNPGGSSAIGGGFGGGSGGIGDDTMSTEPGDDVEEPTDHKEDMPGEDSSLPPQEEMFNVAKNIASETEDVQKTLKAVKNLIQTRYSDPIEASDLILQLFNEESPVLKSVARRLALYLIGL